MKKYAPIGVLAVLAVLGGVLFARDFQTSRAKTSPSPTPQSPITTLSPSQMPAVTFKFSPDAHYVTVSLSNLHADLVEYNLIYDYVFKGEPKNSGVAGSVKLNGKTEYSKQELLGSESSGKFTYHTNITNAFLEVTLRDAAGRSLYPAITYPFTVSAGSTVTLTPSQ